MYRTTNTAVVTTNLVTGISLLLLVSVSVATAQESRPDLSGNWWRMADRSLETGRVLQQAPRILTEHGDALMAAFDPADDPAVRCEHPGAIRVILSPYPIRFELTDEEVKIEYEEWATTRTVHLQSVEPDPDTPHTSMGLSLGHYANGKLIIQTSNLATGLNMSTGFFWTSEDASITEEYYVVEDNSILTLRMTFTDPVMLAEPWIIEKRWARYDGDLLDFECIDRERP